MQVTATESFTAQIVFKTTATSGVIIGTRPTVANWTLQLVNGQVQFSLFDGMNSSTITSNIAVNDGNWHRIAAVRDATNHVLHLYVDGVEVATPVVDVTTGSLEANDNPNGVDPVVLGAYNTLQNELAFDVDTLRFTTAALAPAALLPANYVKPTPPSPSTNPPGGPTSLPGLQFWFPPYDSSRDFSDWNGYANPLPQQPFQGMEAGSMLDASSNAYHVSSSAVLQPVLYGNDTTIGPYWTFTAPPNASSGTALDVQSSNSNSGLNPTNFDFVQNTGVFTLTTFVNIGASTGGYMTLFDTDQALTNEPGFSLFVQQNGQLNLIVSTGSSQSVRFIGADAGLSLAQNQWYFVAVVGSGPNKPVQFFVAPAGASSTSDYISATTLAGPNGTYNTDTSHDLFIGGRTDSDQAEPFNGEMVNQTIFKSALTPAQIQQLFLFGKAEKVNLASQLPLTTSPTSVRLVSSSDTGISSSDGITNLNNSGPSSTLQFQISGTIAGAVVTLFADGTPIGSATAGGTTTVITTNGSTLIGDGTHAITAQQVLSGRPKSVNSRPLMMQVDTVRPTQTITSVPPNQRITSIAQLTIVFSEPIYGLSLNDFALTRNGGANLLTSAQTLSTTDHITWTAGNLSTLLNAQGTDVLNLTLAGAPATDAAGNVDRTTGSTRFSSPVVISESLFYDNSHFNKNIEGVAGGTIDDKAIDTTKSAYLSGSSSASFANLSSYTDGINGIMVDMFGEPGQITANDFSFAVGTNNAASKWAPARAPSTVSVRTGAGTSGSDRVELTWADGSIINEWLEVTVLADANTGLAAPFTFFFGSLVGDSGTGNTVVFAITNATDQTAIATHVGVAPVTNTYDYNKDGFVNSTDEAVANTNSDFLQYIKILPGTGAGTSNRGRRQPVLRRFEIQ